MMVGPAAAERPASPVTKTVRGDLKIVESKTLDTAFAIVFYEKSSPQILELGSFG